MIMRILKKFTFYKLVIMRILKKCENYRNLTVITIVFLNFFLLSMFII